MSALDNLHNRIDLVNIPYTDRGSRLLLFCRGDTLSIRLAERWEKWEAEVGHYRQRPPIIDQLTIVGPDGSPFRFVSDTYPHIVTITTSVGNFEWTLVDPETFLVRLPSGQYGFHFEVMAERGQTDRRGGTLHGKRNVAYTTNARILDNVLVGSTSELFQVRLSLDAASNDALLLNITPRLSFNRSIPALDEAFATVRAGWQAWLDATPPVLDSYRNQYDYAWWIMRAGLLNTRYYFTREALVPSKIHYVGVWLWDQFFHALAYRHVNTELAENQLRIVLDHQRSDGMLPDAIHDEGLVTHLLAPVEADVTKPPLIAWTALKLFEQSGRLDFLQELYEPLVRLHHWWIHDNLNACGLCEYRHPFSSGLDDSPLWDEGMPVVAPDLNTYVYVQWECLAKIAELIGEASDAVQYRRSADEWLKRMVDVLWDEERGIFNSLHNGRKGATLTSLNLMPLWTGNLPAAITDRLLRHLTDPSTFWPTWPLPSVALSDPKFNSEQMWRGPTWANINYLFVEALLRVGQPDLARQLRRKTLDLIGQHADIYEYYNPLTGGPPKKAARLYGWTSALYIDLAIQETEDYEKR